MNKPEEKQKSLKNTFEKTKIQIIKNKIPKQIDELEKKNSKT